MAHLERRLARRALAAEEAVLVERNGDRRLEAVLGRLDVSDAVRLGQTLPAHGWSQAPTDDGPAATVRARSTPPLPEAPRRTLKQSLCYVRTLRATPATARSNERTSRATRDAQRPSRSPLPAINAMTPRLGPPRRGRRCASRPGRSREPRNGGSSASARQPRRPPRAPRPWARRNGSIRHSARRR